MLHGYALLAACLRLRGLTKLALIFVSSFILFACGGMIIKLHPMHRLRKVPMPEQCR